MSEQLEIKGLNLLFQRPLEPIFTSRDDGRSSFIVPKQYLTDEFKNIEDSHLENRFGDDIEVKIPLPEIQPPNIKFAMEISKTQQFCLFNNCHKRIAAQLIQLFMDIPKRMDFMAIAAYVRDRINAVLFQYAYGVAVEHRHDTKTVVVPSIVELFPKCFVTPNSFSKGRSVGSVLSPTNRVAIDIPELYTAGKLEEEQRLAYFREDIGVNSHHWHWHAVYPNEGPTEVVDKDRRGELFYYMHHQILARYNVERFCNQMARVQPLNNLRKEIHEGYFPKLLSSTTDRTYPARTTNVKLTDITRPQAEIEISEVQRWTDRIHEAIDLGYVICPEGRKLSLDPINGIDILGNIIESSQLSVHPQYYGNLHNMGHNLIALSHDPEGRHAEDYSVMGDVTTAMRDPVFYRWHGYIDMIFRKHKSLLPSYTDAELKFNGIFVDSVNCSLLNFKKIKSNFLITYKEVSTVDLGAGLDFGPNGNVLARFTHLQNLPFKYDFCVTNMNDNELRGTCRLFLLPQQDEREVPLKFNEVRDFAIEMDKFDVYLQPGINKFSRGSDESNVTIPFSRSFRKVGASNLPTNDEEKIEFKFCGCGWPQHMLLPKGNETNFGMKFDLFCMISNYDDDAVDDLQHELTSACNDSYSYCGLKNKLYPDRRAMGFPFDRKSPFDNLNQFVNSYCNMQKQEIHIKYDENVK